MTGSADVAGFVEPPEPDQAAIAAGGRDQGSPGMRAHQPAYYGALVLDLEDYNFEAVCLQAWRASFH